MIKSFKIKYYINNLIDIKLDATTLKYDEYIDDLY